ncbi:MAG: UDP-N-acetylglucosamine 1-carboxyvinyltransferase, partial [Firmicutes bacterium]|nr:UDP-N-acetylglucosamine 1-carboxyvinyltransferase [Bacillota bacterium]
MHRYMIAGGNRLQGAVRVSGSKNATLPIVAASLLLDGECTIEGIPRLRDVAVMRDVLTHLGAAVSWEKDTMRIDARGVDCQEVSEDLMRRMRASNLVLGPLISRFKYAKISYPGGCNIGTRPMNLHLKGLQALGVEITEKFGYITAAAQKLQGSEVYLDMPSVGAT